MTLLTYLPLAAAGLALITAWISAVGVLEQLVGRKADLAHRSVNHAGLVHAELDFTGLHFLHRRGRRPVVTVPVLGLGIRPRGPSTLPSLPTERIMSGVAITASKSVQPSVWISADHLLAADEIGAGFLRFALLVAGSDHQHFLRSCPARSAARRCRGPSGRHAWDRRPGACAPRRSRRTWRT